MTLHNGTTRNTTEVLLAGEGAEINLCGMAIADKNQHVDNHTSIDHAVPNCTSNELFKYVLDDQSVGAFAGLVLVRPDAQHTNSQQTNRNLCATRDARMYTQPQLEIYADDVKCSHGATVGQLDEGALFYMRSRGIAEKEARLLLMFAFVNEVIDTIRLEALKEREKVEKCGHGLGRRRHRIAFGIPDALPFEDGERPDRFRQGNGHLSNDECASAIRRFWHPGLKNLFLCHLSENNNTPSLAFASAAEALRSIRVTPSAKDLLSIRVTPSAKALLSIRVTLSAKDITNLQTLPRTHASQLFLLGR
jgi:hypothetical protein